MVSGKDGSRRAAWPGRPLMVAAALGLFLACGPTFNQPLGRLATPEHHTAIGMKLLRQERIGSAEREFDLALGQDPNLVEAIVGVGLVRAYRADFPGAWDALKKAGTKAADEEARLSLTLGSLQTRALQYTDCRRRGLNCPEEEWLAEAESLFAEAIRSAPSSEAADFWLGECYLAAGQWDKASRMYMRVLDKNRDYLAEAKARWQLVQKLQVVKHPSELARGIALEKRVSRAKAAALIAQERHIVDLLKAQARRPGPGASKRPLKATDIAGHDLQREMETVISLNLKGLTVSQDGRFLPEEPLNRAGLAQVLEEILVRIKGAGLPAGRFRDDRSPFLDVPPEAPYLSAVILVTFRGLMEPRPDGDFAPLRPVEGAEALWAMARLNEELR